MIIIRESGAEQAAQALKFNTGRLRLAIGKALREGRSILKRLIMARYTAKSPFRLGMVKSRVSGMTGRITVSGSRNSLRHFIYRPSTRPPHNPPGGIFVQVVRGQGGNLPHAFIGRGKLWERTGEKRNPKEAKEKGLLREKLRYLSTVSLPGMADAVSDTAMARMAERLGIELEAVFV